MLKCQNQPLSHFHPKRQFGQFCTPVSPFKPRHSSKTLKPRHSSKTLKPRHSSKTLKPGHSLKTLKPRYSSKTLKPRHSSKTLNYSSDVYGLTMRDCGLLVARSLLALTHHWHAAECYSADQSDEPLAAREGVQKLHLKQLCIYI